MKTTSGCGCGKGNGCGCQTCDNGLLERPRYFTRQLVTPVEMNLEQSYFRDRLRRHNRMLHGWGVVCGAEVCAVPKSDGSGIEPWKVVVRTGYALGPYGDEIMIDCERVVDLRTEGVSGICGERSPASDPWCSQVFVRQQPQRVFVAVRYREMMTRPVRVMPAGCGCDDVSCEYSRWCDGYEIGILNDCPDGQTRDVWKDRILHDRPVNTAPERPILRPAGEGGEASPAPAADTGTDAEMLPKMFEEVKALRARLAALEKGQGGVGMLCPFPACPPCPEDPWVGLAEVQLDTDGTILSIDNCSCRRIVISFADYWCQCASSAVQIREVRIEGEQTAGGTGKLIVTIENPRAEPTISLGEGVHVQKVTPSATGDTVTIDFAVDAKALPGPRALTLTYKDCSSVVRPNTLTVSAAKPVVDAGTGNAPTGPRETPTSRRRGSRGGGPG
jgi:hypothetical protein